MRWYNNVFIIYLGETNEKKLKKFKKKKRFFIGKVKLGFIERR